MSRKVLIVIGAFLIIGAAVGGGTKIGLDKADQIYQVRVAEEQRLSKEISVLEEYLQVKKEKLEEYLQVKKEKLEDLREKLD